MIPNVKTGIDFHVLHLGVSYRFQTFYYSEVFYNYLQT